MAKFYIRKGIVRHLENIIEEAEEELILISPYIKADDEIKRLLRNKTRATSIYVIYGKKELNSREKDFFDGIGVKTSFLKDLHAKCYLNEKKALLTSMNLYKYSQENNDEMGILVSREDDRKLYLEIYDQAMNWKTASSQVAIDKNDKTKSESRKARTKPGPAPEKPTDGFCIRCIDVLPANTAQPYCKSCFRSWNRFKNKAYEEKYCHTCGNEHAASFGKPVCPACYRKYKDMFVFATS